LVEEVHELVGVFPIVVAGPATGRTWRAPLSRAAFACPCAFLSACLALIALDETAARAQSVTSDLFNPRRTTQVAPDNLALRQISGSPSSAVLDPNATLDPTTTFDPNRDPKRKANQPAESRIGKVPVYGLPAANGAADSGYDSLNRKRKPPKYYPAQARPKPAPGPGSPPPKQPPVNLAGQLRLSIPPSETANKQPLPPAMAGTVVGQPQRRRLKIDDDPFGAVGDYAGSFLIKSAVEVSGGYDTNPGRIFEPHGLPLWVVAPEFLAVSNWERHALVADLRGSFTGYGGSLPTLIDGQISPAPTNVDRPDFTGHVDGRLDVTEDFDLTAQTRLHVGTDNPGSPNIQAGLAKYPIFATFGGTFGFDQRFNRLQVSAGATVDRTVYQDSLLTDGEHSSNDDRDYNQYGGVGRVSYELKPGLKPFVEIEGDERVHDLPVDRSGFQRDSNGGYVKGGTSFEFSRLLTGEVAVGWTERSYVDPRLNKLDGLLTSGSLIWSVTPLTTAKFITDTQIAETTLPDTSGIFVHTYTFEVDHDFRRWLTAIGRFTYGTYDYQGNVRRDKTYSVEGDLIYKMTRSLWIKGSLRHDILDSNVPLSGSSATVVMLGVRLQN
jgi:hypothetical protein